MLTFLGRLHRCITYWFSLIEYVSIPNITGYPDKWFVIYRLKALLFMLIRVFEFELTVPVVAKESQPQSSIAKVTSEHYKFLGLILSVHQSLYVDIRWVTSHWVNLGPFGCDINILHACFVPRCNVTG